MKKVKKNLFTHVVFTVAFAIAISVFSTPAVAQNDITVTVPVHLRNVHPDIVECWMLVYLGGVESNEIARWATQLEFDPSGDGSFDADVVVTVDLRQVVGYHSPTSAKFNGRKGNYAYEDLKGENFTLYKVNFLVINSEGVRHMMSPPTSTTAPAWAKFEGVSTSTSTVGQMKEIVKD